LCFHDLLAIVGGKLESVPSSIHRSTPTSATPAVEGLSDARFNTEITLVKVGSWPTSGTTLATNRSAIMPRLTQVYNSAFNAEFAARGPKLAKRKFLCK